MKLDEYGQTLEQVLRDSPVPLTAAELTAKVGCSRQRVYTWLKGNAGHLAEQGKDRAGGTRFTWVDGPATMVTTGAKPVGMGSPLVVTSFHVEDGQIVLLLTGEDGSEFDAVAHHQ